MKDVFHLHLHPLQIVIVFLIYLFFFHCSPKFAVVVVKKRINARIMAAKGRQLVNPPPGTVVDTCITKPEWCVCVCGCVCVCVCACACVRVCVIHNHHRHRYDFFLVSQSVRQGTVTPTHFNVIVDTSGLKPDHIQRLTYKLCHLYYNWPVSDARKTRKLAQFVVAVLFLLCCAFKMSCLVYMFLVIVPDFILYTIHTYIYKCPLSCFVLCDQSC